jgi:FAD binding domain of DNA photolyase
VTDPRSGGGLGAHGGKPGRQDHRADADQPVHDPGGRVGLSEAEAEDRRHEVELRVRLVVGSFLTEDLGIDWRWGEWHFMRLPVDGDQANNNGNWQWIALAGTDRQPASLAHLQPAPDGGARSRRRVCPPLPAGAS